MKHRAEKNSIDTTSRREKHEKASLAVSDSSRSADGDINVSSLTIDSSQSSSSPSGEISIEQPLDVTQGGNNNDKDHSSDDVHDEENEELVQDTQTTKQRKRNRRKKKNNTQKNETETLDNGAGAEEVVTSQTSLVSDSPRPTNSESPTDDGIAVKQSRNNNNKKGHPLIVECPHCGGTIVIQAIKCAIFRHAIFKKNGRQIPPHTKRELCEEYIAKDMVWGCGKPFKIVDKSTAVACDYI